MPFLRVVQSQSRLYLQRGGGDGDVAQLHAGPAGWEAWVLTTPRTVLVVHSRNGSTGEVEVREPEVQRSLFQLNSRTAWATRKKENDKEKRNSVCFS